jgi:hypothetical protein
VHSPRRRPPPRAIIVVYDTYLTARSVLRFGRTDDIIIIMFSQSSPVGRGGVFRRLTAARVCAYPFVCISGSIKHIIYVYYAHAHYKPTAAVAYDDDVAAGVAAAECSFSRRFFLYILSFIYRIRLPKG